MKKILSSFLIVLLLLFILWAVSSWYFGAQSEKAFKAYLQQSSQLVGKKFFRPELLSYKKNLTGAQAKVLLSSDFPLLSERVGELTLDVTMKNGPLFFSNSGVHLGSSQWQVSIDQSLDNTVLEEWFPKVLPTASARIDFKNIAHYHAKADTTFAQSKLTGVYHLDTQDNRGAATLTQFKWGSRRHGLSAENIKISYQHQQAITANYKPGTASVVVSSLLVRHEKLPKPMRLDLKLKSNISQNNNDLSGFVKLLINNNQSRNYPFETAKLSLLFSGLSADAFIAYNDANAQLENLHQQAQWLLEENGELPEGQDQIWQLYDQIETSTQALPQSLLKLGEKSLIQMNVVSQYKNKDSKLKANFKVDQEHSTVKSWLSLLKGEAQVKLDPLLLEELKGMIPLKKPSFKLILKDSKLMMMQH